MGYKFQFVTLAGFHSLNHAMFELASGYRDRGMAAYSELQQAEFASEAAGYTATRHQREVGTGYFDAVATAVSGGQASTVALKESTEAAQFIAAAAEEEQNMAQRYWVIGGEYQRLPLQGHRAGHRKSFTGPIDDELKARTEWQRLTFRDHCGATNALFDLRGADRCSELR